MKNISILLMLLGLLISQNLAQGLLQLNGAHITQTPNSQIILHNSSWVNNNGTLLADSSVVAFTGTSTDSIGGTTPTTFGRLQINKNGGQVHLKRDIEVSDSLALTHGLLTLGEHNLRLLPGAQTSAGSAASYIQTAGGGRLHAEVGSSPQLFPLGGNTYRPAILQNHGSLDYFGVRVTDEVLKQGINGNSITAEAVASTWLINEENAGGSDLDITLQWNSSDELSDFDRNCAYISRYKNRWDKSERVASQGNDPYTIQRTDVNKAGIFAVLTYRPKRLAPQNCANCAQIRFDLCEGEAQPDLEALLSSNAKYEAGSSFLWFADNNGSLGAPIPTPSPNMAQNSTNFYWVSQDKYGCESIARKVRIRVRKTSIVVFDLPYAGCEGGYLDLSDWVSDSRGIATGFDFWTSPPGPGAISLGSVTAQNGQVNYGQYVGISLPPNPVTYYATAINNTGCQVTGSGQINSRATPTLAPISTVIVNSGDAVQVTFNTVQATYVFWQVTSYLGGNSIGLLGNIGTRDIIFTANNPGTQPRVAHIRAIAYNQNCASASRTFQIVVHPAPNSRQAANQLQFTAFKLNPHDVQVDWNIQSEFDIKHMEVEKAKGERDWETIGQVDFAGNQISQSYTDRGGMSNVTKYRLKILLADGRIIWSHEAEVNFDFFDSKRFTLYPNPSAGRFKLRAEGELEGEWRYKMTDQLGRAILIGTLQGRETAFDISHLPAAHYFLLLTSPSGRRYLEKVVRQ